MDTLRSGKRRMAVIGAGSWGTALANLLAEQEPVDLWVFEEDLFHAMAKERENKVFLPGVQLLDRVRLTHSLEEAFSGKDILVCALPSHVVREIFSRAQPYIQGDTRIVSATKGLENISHQTTSRVLREVIDRGLKVEIACLSGPSFAREVSRKLPTAVAAAGTSPEAAQMAQNLFSRTYFRVYTNPDLMGVELGGAIKNVMAIAAGAADGLGFGHSSRAALITRGLAEMTRLGVKMGADARTFSGLAGLGDLVLTCTGDLSRNRSLGLELGKGRSLPAVLGEMRMVAEGFRTTKALWELAKKLEVEMPITGKVYEILYEGKAPREAVAELMSRHPRSELERF
jgi:glycerol-3-phosphate dehydrogenase (NAD(P)+)